MYASGLMNFLTPPQGAAGIPPATSSGDMTATAMPSPGAPMVPRPYAPVTAALGLTGASNPLGPVIASLAPALTRFLPPLANQQAGGGLAAPPPAAPSGGGAQLFRRS